MNASGIAVKSLSIDSNVLQILSVYANCHMSMSENIIKDFARRKQSLMNPLDSVWILRVCRSFAATDCSCQYE